MDTKIIHYHKKTILTINEQGVHYLNEQDIEQFIDFNICRKNWVLFVSSGEDFKGKNITEDDTNCVGQRDMFNIPPYIEFFTNPRTRFEFSEGWLDQLFHRQKHHSDFLKFQQAISNAGWATFDMG